MRCDFCRVKFHLHLELMLINCGLVRLLSCVSISVSLRSTHDEFAVV